MKPVLIVSVLVLVGMAAFTDSLTQLLYSIVGLLGVIALRLVLS